MAQSSFLDAIGQSILDSASSIDAHIDAGALVDKILCHEELLEKGILVRRQAGFFCIFVSHQWLGFNHPDPNSEQLPVLQQALLHLLAGGDIGVDITTEFFGWRSRFSEKHRASIKDGYIWMDWFSIPQHSLEAQHGQQRDLDGTPKWDAMPSLATQDDYIRLIPEYVEASDLFVVLAPRCRHSNGLRCSFGSWTERGWCRLELWCKMMSVNVKMPVVLISGSDRINFAMPMHWIDHPPHEGQFTIEADRHSVINVTREALSQKMSSSKASKKWDVYRYFVARYETLSGHGFRQRTKDEFLKDFNFSSLHSATNRCMSPMACAVLSADAEMIRVLCSEGLDVNRFDGAIPEVNIFQAMSPLMLATMLGWRNETVLLALLDHKANVDATTEFGSPLLGWCKSERTVDLLIHHRADVNQQKESVFLPPISSACENAAPTSVIRSLLEHKACVNPRKNGLGSAHPLAFLAMRPENSKSLEVAKLLLDARADVDLQYRAAGVWRTRELMCRAGVRVLGPRTPKIAQFIAEWSTTPLGVACFFGCDELVEFLLDANADPEKPNARGHTPFQLAQSESVMKVIHLHRTTFSI
ncbi:unnamed protein product [Effrenium voratum]|nr:unnamed protein product [Effrenium voratum]